MLGETTATESRPRSFMFSNSPSLLSAIGAFWPGAAGLASSAIAIMSEEAKNWDYCEVLEGEAAQYGAYLDLVDELVARQTAGLQVDIKRSCELLWRHVLRVAILQAIAAKVTPPPDEQDSMNAIVMFLRANHYWQRSIGELLHQIFQEAIAVLAPNATGAMDFYAALLRRGTSPGFTEAAAAVPRVLRNKSLLLVIDTMESYRIHSQSMRQGLRGIIVAILGLLSDRNFDRAGLRFFLPAEIFDDVSVDMPGKIIGSTVFLRWRTGDLLTMLTKRYLEMLRRTDLIAGRQSDDLTQLVDQATDRTMHGGDGRTLREQFWYVNEFLPKRVLNRFGFKEDCFAYIFRHTQRRPRELIYVFNQIIDRAQRAGELPTISEESVCSGLHDPTTLQLLLNEQLSPYQGYVSSIIDRARSVFFNTHVYSQVRTFASLRRHFTHWGALVTLTRTNLSSFCLGLGS